MTIQFPIESCNPPIFPQESSGSQNSTNSSTVNQTATNQPTQVNPTNNQESQSVVDFPGLFGLYDNSADQIADPTEIPPEVPTPEAPSTSSPQPPTAPPSFNIPAPIHPYGQDGHPIADLTKRHFWGVLSRYSPVRMVLRVLFLPKIVYSSLGLVTYKAYTLLQAKDQHKLHEQNLGDPTIFRKLMNIAYKEPLISRGSNLLFTLLKSILQLVVKLIIKWIPTLLHLPIFLDRFLDYNLTEAPNALSTKTLRIIHGLLFGLIAIPLNLLHGLLGQVPHHNSKKLRNLVKIIQHQWFWFKTFCLERSGLDPLSYGDRFWTPKTAPTKLHESQIYIAPHLQPKAEIWNLLRNQTPLPEYPEHTDLIKSLGIDPWSPNSEEFLLVELASPTEEAAVHGYKNSKSQAFPGKYLQIPSPTAAAKHLNLKNLEFEKVLETITNEVKGNKSALWRLSENDLFNLPLTSDANPYSTQLDNHLKNWWKSNKTDLENIPKTDRRQIVELVNAAIVKFIVGQSSTKIVLVSRNPIHAREFGNTLKQQAGL